MWKTAIALIGLMLAGCGTSNPENVVNTWAAATLRGDYETAEALMYGVKENPWMQMAWHNDTHRQIVARGRTSYRIIPRSPQRTIVRFSGGPDPDVCVWVTVIDGQISDLSVYVLCDPQPTPTRGPDMLLLPTPTPVPGVDV